MAPHPSNISLTGYAHPQYAEALSEFGALCHLSLSNGWVLERDIPDTVYRDAMGCYPLFACEDWSQLSHDLDESGTDLVSLGLVTDPFGAYTETDLKRCFPDVMYAYKEHFVTDLQQSKADFVSKHHRRYAHKASRELQVEFCEHPDDYLDTWVDLYSNLIARHQITGITTFSHQSFKQQLDVPGMVMFRASAGQETVGIVLWYCMGDVAYYHLAAYNERGYVARASFALFWFAIDYFQATGLRWLNLGAGAGVTNSGDDGLTRFKRGWSTGTRTAYFCGRIFDKDKYNSLVGNTKNVLQSNYFPLYRIAAKK